MIREAWGERDRRGLTRALGAIPGWPSPARIRANGPSLTGPGRLLARLLKSQNEGALPPLNSPTKGHTALGTLFY